MTKVDRYLVLIPSQPRRSYQPDETDMVVDDEEIHENLFIEAISKQEVIGSLET